MSVQMLRRLFTVQEYHQMLEAGILKESDRVELIRGEIVKMSPIGTRHAACVNRLNELFVMRLVQVAIVAVQNPVELDDYSEPQPDLVLLRRRPDFYESSHPQTRDILLLVEVADTTVKFDREVKIPLYAEAGIVEVWLVNIHEQCVEVYGEPAGNGYQHIRKYERGETLFLSGFPDVIFTVNEVLG